MSCKKEPPRDLGGLTCALPKHGYSLHFCWRGLSRYALPLSVWHLHPRIGPALISLKRLTRRIRSLAFETPGRDGRIPKSGYLQIVVLGTGVFHSFCRC